MATKTEVYSGAGVFHVLSELALKHLTSRGFKFKELVMPDGLVHHWFYNEHESVIISHKGASHPHE